MPTAIDVHGQLDNALYEGRMQVVAPDYEVQVCQALRVPQVLHIQPQAQASPCMPSACQRHGNLSSCHASATLQAVVFSTGVARLSEGKNGDLYHGPRVGIRVCMIGGFQWLSQEWVAYLWVLLLLGQTVRVQPAMTSLPSVLAQ